jgi:hypothetical protein
MAYMTSGNPNRWGFKRMPSGGPPLNDSAAIIGHLLSASVSSEIPSKCPMAAQVFTLGEPAATSPESTGYRQSILAKGFTHFVKPSIIYQKHVRRI